MSDDVASPRKVFHFPQKEEVPDEERARRILAEATRLANLAPGEWKLWYLGKAKEFDIAPEQFAELITAQIVDRDEKAKAKLAEERLQEQKAERQRKVEAQEFREKVRAEDAAAKKAKGKSRAFVDIAKLPVDAQGAKLVELAAQLKEDPDALAAEFADYRGATAEIETKSGSDVELWDEPVTTAAVLEELIACISKYISARPHEVLAIALWFMSAWVHDAANWSVYLVITAPAIDCGKSTLVIGLGSRLLPKPAAMGGKLTEATLFRLIDAEKPTVLLDNADELFKKNQDVCDLFLTGHMRGVPVRRNVRIGREWVPIEFNIFCPKIVSLLGRQPEALESRSMFIDLLRPIPGEEPVEINPFDDAQMEELKTLKRKLARWSADNLAALKTATPVYPPGLGATRPRNLAKLLLNIAELAGSEWAEATRPALERLLREERKSSWLEMLLQELWVVYFEERRTAVTSEELPKRLTADPTSDWNNYLGKNRKPNQWDIGNILGRIGIRSRQVGKRRVGGYHLKDFLENRIFERWLRRQPLNLSPAKVAPKRRRSRRKKSSRSRKARG